MPWPGITDYSEAVQNARLCFRGTELESGEVSLNQRGMPLVFSGAFACVYPVSVGNRTVAVRCFTREVSDQQARYGELSNYLLNVLPPSFVRFEYVEHGISIRGDWYPIVKMDWVDGELLSRFVGSRLNQPDTLRRVAVQWRGDTTANLRGLRIAHNDLQHGNVMVERDGSIRLVDYDGMFLPRFRGERSPELGHKNYQHPQRKVEHYDENVDNFPSLVIYLSLLAVASDPGLWDFHDEDNLIFTRNDYADPGQSELFGRLKRSHDQAVAKLAERLEEYCALPVEKVPDLETVLQDISPTAPVPPPTATPPTPTRSTVPSTSNSYRQALRTPQPTPAPPAPPPAISRSRKPGGLKKVMLGVAVAIVAVTVTAVIAGAFTGSGGNGVNGGSGVSGGNLATGGSRASDPSSQALVITDVGVAPTVTLNLSSSSINENGGSSRITASLSSPSSAMTTLTVTAAPGAGADSGDYSLSGPTLTIAPGATTSAGALTVSAIDNAIDAPDKTVSISGGASNPLGVIDPAAVTLTIADDDTTPMVTLDLSSSSISENGGTADVTASLSGTSSQDVTVVVSASPVSPAVSGDFAITSSKTLTIAAGSTDSTGTVTITGIDNSLDAPDKSVTLTATVSGGRGASAPPSLMLIITDDDAAPTVTLDLSSLSISENGGTANVTASLSGASSQDVTVVVSASPVSPAVSGDFAITSNKTLTIAAGSTGSTGTVTITGIDNSLDAPDKSLAVAATVSGRGVSAPSGRMLTISDDEETPTVTLGLSSPSISESGGTANVIASLSGASSQDVTVVVSASPVSPAVTGDFTITSNKTLTISAGSTGSTGTVVITGIDNSVDEPDKSVVVSATVRGHGASAPSSQTLTILDDDAAPAVTLHLSSSSISENGGTASVTASLSGPSSQDVTVVVSASPVSPAVSGDFTFTSNKTLTIPAGSTGSTGTVTIKGVDNRVDEPDKTVTVAATVRGHEVSTPSSQTLTILDDDAAPGVTLNLSPSSISENGGVANVTASLSSPSSQDVILTVSAIPVSPAVSGDFTITSNKTLTVLAGTTSSTGTVTITGVDNNGDAPDKSVMVTATVSGGRGASAPSSRMLTIADDDAAPAVTLDLSPSSISENGGTARVTASLSGPSSQDVTVVVSASPVSPAVSGDFTITSNKTLTVLAGSTSSTGTVTITGVDNSVDEPDKTVTVAATVRGHGVSAPSSQTLTILDDDATPTVTLHLSSSSISENGGTASVTASLSAPSSQDVTVIVSASPVSPTVSSDFTITSNKALTIPAGSTRSTGTVIITGVDNSVDAPDKTVTVAATVSGHGVSAPSSRTLTIRDGEGTPMVTLDLSPSSISENGGTADVTASLSGPSSQDVILTVSVIPVSPTVGGDFTITSNKTLTIAAGSTISTGTVTITGIDNGVDEPRKSITVTATVSGGRGVSAPSGRMLTITDDEETPTVTLNLSSSSISENGGTANVTASLSGPSSQDVTLTVSAIPISPTVSGDFAITSNNTLTIAAGTTSSTGTVTIKGVDNSVDEPDKSVIVGATVSGGHGVSAPSLRHLTITDDDAAPAATLNLGSSYVGENGGVANVTASAFTPRRTCQIQRPRQPQE